MKLGESIRRNRSKGSASPPRKGSGRSKGGGGAGGRRPPRLVLIALGVLLGGWVTGYLFATQVAFPASKAPASEYLLIPDLRGLSLGDAVALLAQNNLVILAVDSIHHPDASVGTILAQGPLPGQLAVLHDSVRLTLSLGAERRPVPDVAGLSEDRALVMLRASGFTVLVDSLESELPVGTAVATSPRAGTERAIPSEVRLAVSLGPPFVLMPDLLGMREEDARAILATMGLVVGEVGERAQLFNPGEVVEQNPAPGAEIRNGGAVSLVISRRRFF